MHLRARFGRPLRLGIIGGGPDSWIGAMHRGAATMDGWFSVAAGVFSSDPARSRAAGAPIGIDPARSYGDVAEMLQAEARHAEGIDATGLLLFTLIHLFEVIVAGVWNELRSMITGWYTLPADRSVKERR